MLDDSATSVELLDASRNSIEVVNEFRSFACIMFTGAHNGQSAEVDALSETFDIGEEMKHSGGNVRMFRQLLRYLANSKAAKVFICHLSLTEARWKELHQAGATSRIGHLMLMNVDFSGNFFSVISVSESALSMFCIYLGSLMRRHHAAIPLPSEPNFEWVFWIGPKSSGNPSAHVKMKRRLLAK